MGENIAITRVELYERLWTTPMTRLQAEYGVTRADLIAACAKHNIPRPPVGYWSMKTHGKTPPRPSLPPSDEDHIIRWETKNDGSLVLDAPSQPKKSSQADSPDATAVASRTRRTAWHPLVAVARTQLLRLKPDSEQLIYTNALNGASIQVARKSIDRALRLFQTLIDLWNKAGGTVLDSNVQHAVGTAFCLGSRSVPVHLAEITEPAPASPPSNRYQPRQSAPPRQPTGRLMLAVPEGQSGSLPSSWKEDGLQRLDDILPQIVESLPAQIERWQVTLADRLCEKRQWDRLHAHRAAKAKLDEDEKGWEKAILEDMRKWQQAEEIRKYLAELRRSIDTGMQRITNLKFYENWQAWANYLATKLDPMMRAPLRPGEPAPAHETPVSELDLTNLSRATVEAIGAKTAEDLAKVTNADAARHTTEPQKVRDELRRVLECLGYDVSERHGRR